MKLSPQLSTVGVATIQTAGAVERPARSPAESSFSTTPSVDMG
jgi:hypothetical protein